MKPSNYKYIFVLRSAVTVFFSFLFLNVYGQINVTKRDVNCKNGADGWIRVQVPNATPPVKYKWNDGLSGQNRTGLKAGSYIVTITDATKCDHVQVVEISETQKKLEIIIDYLPYGTGVACGENQPIIVRAEAIGGTKPYKINGSQKIQYLQEINKSQWVEFNVEDSNGCKERDRRVVLVSKRSCPKDPNDILGPAGYNTPQWIAVNDTMDYTIRFENDALEASAPAQKVVITHPFGDKVNPFSFRVGSFGFGETFIDVPPNKSVFQTRLDLTATQGVFVDVAAGYDLQNNQAFWSFTAIDPSTGQQPFDPLLGFLPVNDTLTGSGEGFVSFSIKPKTSALTGDTIRADAGIVFNINEPIPTNIWKNVIDAVAPTSQLLSLPDTVDTSIFDLSWTASDDANGSGIREVTLFVSENEAPFEAFVTIPGDSLFNYSFKGEFDYKYDFYIRATDNTGNTEMKSDAETGTRVLPEKELRFDLFAENTVCQSDTFTIKWNAVSIDSVDIEYSIVGNSNFEFIKKVGGNEALFNWIAPNILSEQTIEFRITDITNITYSDTSQILEIRAAPIVEAGDNVTSCGGEIVTLSAAGANEYTWSPQIGLNNPVNAIQSFLADSTERYFLEGVDAFGCRGIDSIDIIVLPEYNSFVYHPICEGDSVFIGGNYVYDEGSYEEQFTSINNCDSIITNIVTLLAESWPGGKTVYVDSAATGLNNGGSWANAFKDLQDALCIAYTIDSVNTVWVANGTYTPSPHGVRMLSFVVQDSIQLLGGFSGGETMAAQRNYLVNKTRLSGNVGASFNEIDNSVHVLRIDPASVNSLIDGFIIADGYADGATFRDQRAAAILSEGNATLENIHFTNHFAISDGVVILNLGTSAKLTLKNCTFEYDINSQLNHILNSTNAELIFKENVNIEKE